MCLITINMVATFIRLNWDLIDISVYADLASLIWLSNSDEMWFYLCAAIAL